MRGGEESTVKSLGRQPKGEGRRRRKDLHISSLPVLNSERPIYTMTDYDDMAAMMEQVTKEMDEKNREPIVESKKIRLPTKSDHTIQVWIGEPEMEGSTMIAEKETVSQAQACLSIDCAHFVLETGETRSLNVKLIDKNSNKLDNLWVKRVDVANASDYEDPNRFPVSNPNTLGKEDLENKGGLAKVMVSLYAQTQVGFIKGDETTYVIDESTRSATVGPYHGCAMMGKAKHGLQNLSRDEKRVVIDCNGKHFVACLSPNGEHGLGEASASLPCVDRYIPPQCLINNKMKNHQFEKLNKHYQQTGTWPKDKAATKMFLGDTGSKKKDTSDGSKKKKKGTKTVAKKGTSTKTAINKKNRGARKQPPELLPLPSLPALSALPAFPLPALLDLPASPASTSVPNEQVEV